MDTNHGTGAFNNYICAFTCLPRQVQKLIDPAFKLSPGLAKSLIEQCLLTKRRPSMTKWTLKKLFSTHIRYVATLSHLLPNLQ